MLRGGRVAAIVLVEEAVSFCNDVVGYFGGDGCCATWLTILVEEGCIR